MKELNTLQIDKTSQEIQAPIKQEYKKVGSMRKIPGLTLYQFNLKDLSLTPVKIKSEVAIGLDKKVQRTNKAEYSDKCIYLQALNYKNALRKVNKMIKI